METKWLIDNMTDAEREVAFGLANGCYQRNILRGVEALSGSTLKGKAGRYRSRYQQSRKALFARLTKAGIHIGEMRAERGRRVLILGKAARDV